MKKNIFIVLAVMTLVLMPVTTFAKSNFENGANRRKQGITRSEKNLQKQTQRLRMRGERKIKRNIDLLENLIKKVSSSRKLEGDEKKMLIDEIKMDIDQLKYLKLNLDSETDKRKLLEIVKSIPSRGSLLGKYMPRIN